MTKRKNGTRVRVQTIREYEYPTSMLRKGMEIQYAESLAKEDLEKDMVEASRDGRAVSSIFRDYKVDIIEGFVTRGSLRKKDPEAKIASGFSFNEMVSYLTKCDFRDKYGSIDTDTNPAIFKDILIDGQMCTVMQDNIEEYYINRHDYYYNILDAFCNGNPRIW